MSGVGELMAEGFTPIENLTGMLEVAVVWPEEHRRSVPEVRGWLLKDEQLQGRLWAVRTPWPGWTLEDVVVYLWSLADQHTDPDSRVRAAADALRWDEPRARRQLELARLKDIE